LADQQVNLAVARSCQISMGSFLK